MKISVCICTFRRPVLLASLLDTIGKQQLGHLTTDVELIVVDNDPDHSARPVLEKWRGPTGFSLLFLHEPVPNISIARNTAVQRTSGEWIAFIDDDELPQSDWLMQLVETQRRFHADAVFGPVIPLYHPQTANWIRQGGFFDRARFVTGTLINERNARTSNALVRAESLMSIVGPFDISFGRTGGEDSLLFRDLQAKGCHFVWCDEASVSEFVPAERTNLMWLLRRSFRIGQTWIRAELYRLPMQDRVIRGSYLCVRAGMQLLVSLTCALFWLPVSRTRAVHWMRTSVTQVGKLTGLTNFQYKAYGA